jgi:hypothetical protein
MQEGGHSDPDEEMRCNQVQAKRNSEGNNRALILTPLLLTLRMEAVVCSSRKFISTCNIAPYHSSNNHNLNIHHTKNLRI